METRTPPSQGSTPLAKDGTRVSAAPPRRPSRIRVAIIAVAVAAAVLIGFRAFAYAPRVNVVRVRTGQVNAHVTAEGSVQDYLTVNVSSKITGVITRTFVDQGALVKRGQLLATLESSDLAAQLGAAQAAVSAASDSLVAARAAEVQARAGVQQARQTVEVTLAGLAKARADLTLGQSNLRRNAQLYQLGYISASDMDIYQNAVKDEQAAVSNAVATVGAARQALAGAEAADGNALATVRARSADVNQAQQNAGFARASLSFTQIAAPMNGVVVQRALDAGSTVSPGAPIFVLADPRHEWAAALVDETVVGRVHVGLPALVRLRSGRAVMGRVVRITRDADPVTRELEVDVGFPKPLSAFTLNEEVVVNIRAATARGLVVPASALASAPTGGSSVLVARGGRAVAVPVRAGLTAGGQTVVLTGLRTGDLVVVHPQSVRPGRRIRPLISPMPAAATTPPAM